VSKETVSTFTLSIMNVSLGTKIKMNITKTQATIRNDLDSI